MTRFAIPCVRSAHHFLSPYLQISLIPSNSPLLLTSQVDLDEISSSSWAFPQLEKLAVVRDEDLVFTQDIACLGQRGYGYPEEVRFPLQGVEGLGSGKVSWRTGHEGQEGGSQPGKGRVCVVHSVSRAILFVLSLCLNSSTSNA